MNITRLRYGLFACGLTISLWCFSLLGLKYLVGLSMTPSRAFYLLAIAPAWFYVCSEIGSHADRPHAYAPQAAALLLTGVLGFYVAPSLFRWLLFPEYAPAFRHYQQHAPLALLIGLTLIRLHALKAGKAWVFVGMVTIVGALFFLATRIPALLFGELAVTSTGQMFEFFTLIAIALSYGLLIGTHGRAPLGRALVRLGRLDEALWQTLRRTVFVLLLSVSHGLAALTLAYPADQQWIGVIFLLLAGLWSYTGAALRQTACYSCAYATLVAAIFSCRWYAAYWPETWIIWLLLGLFVGLLVLYSLVLKARCDGMPGALYAWLAMTAALILYEHISFYGLRSQIGITPLLLLWLAAFFVPVGPDARRHRGFKGFLGVLIYTLALLFLFQHGMPALVHLPNVVLIVVLIACFFAAYRAYGWQWLAEQETGEPRLIHHLHWFLNEPHSLLGFFLTATAGVVVIQWLSYSSQGELFGRQLFRMLFVQGVLAAFWFDLARRDRRWVWTVMAEAMISGMILSLRQSLPLLFDVPWTFNWDLAVGVLAALAITAARPLLRQQAPAVRRPIRFTLFGLPLVTIMYALDHNVGFDVLSRVILIYSVIFLWQAYSEKDRLVLAYAFTGLNTFLALLFLHHGIQSLQAYLTPVCISVLILVQVFRDLTSSATANAVRGAALFLLLGMALLEAIAERYTEPQAHLILIALSLLAIATAAVLRIRIFAAAGLFCFIVDLIAIVYIVLSRQDTETLKVVVGVSLTLGGGLIFAAYILYRKHKARLEALRARLRSGFAAWE